MAAALLVAAAGSSLGCRRTGQGADPAFRPFTVEAAELGRSMAALAREKARLVTIHGVVASRLGNRREVYVYLPPGYHAEPERLYPALYVQDGKAAFHDSDWSKESLSLHLAAEGLADRGLIEEIVIVGVANAGSGRAAEYAPWDGVDFGQPVRSRGADYEDFLLRELIPLIEGNFRVSPRREDGVLMGASLGGLAAFVIGMRHPGLLSGIAAQSPYFGWGRFELLELLESGELAGGRELRIWLDMGSSESRLLADLREVESVLRGRGHGSPRDLVVLEDPEGRHSEASWARRVEGILLYFFGKAGGAEGSPGAEPLPLPADPS